MSTANLCDESALERDSKGKFLRWRNSERQEVTVRAAAKAECILPRGDAANVFARDCFTGASRGAGNRPLITLYSIGVGTSCYWVNTPGDVNCGGTICWLGNVHVRAPGLGTAGPRAGGAAVGTESVGGVAHVLAQWECSDGGSLSMDSNGTVTYFPQSGGDGPGTTGGGGCSTPTPGDTNPDGSPVQDEVRHASRWGAVCDSVALPGTLCDPVVSPNADSTLACNRDRTPKEDSMIAKARAQFLRVSFASDSVAERECAYMDSLVSVGLAATLNGKQLFSTGKDDSGNPPHWGVGNSGFAHIDPRTYAAIDSAPTDSLRWRRLAATLLHEAAHAWGNRLHPNEQNSSGLYTDQYFKRLNPTALDSQTCLR
jgi:hypothetical protein